MAQEFFSGKLINSYQYNVRLQECSESTVLLGDVFGVHPDLEFEFDLENGGINFEQFETGIYFDDAEQKFKVGDPVGGNQHRVFYRPVSINSNGNVGEYNTVLKNFYVTYEIYIDLLGTAGEVLTSYSKSTSKAATSSYKASSASIGVDYTEMIKAFRKQ